MLYDKKNYSQVRKLKKKKKFAILVISVKFAFLVYPFWRFHSGLFEALRMFAVFAMLVEVFNPRHISCLACQFKMLSAQLGIDFHSYLIAWFKKTSFCFLRCYCGMGYESGKQSKECKCRRKCKGNKKKRCGGGHHASLYNTCKTLFFSRFFFFPSFFPSFFSFLSFSFFGVRSLFGRESARLKNTE